MCAVNNMADNETTYLSKGICKGCLRSAGPFLLVSVILARLFLDGSLYLLFPEHYYPGCCLAHNSSIPPSRLHFPIFHS